MACELGDDRPEKYPPQKVAEVNVVEVDAIFIGCANFRSLEMLEPLKAEIGKPATCSNKSAFWKPPRMVGLRAAVPGAGQLFQRA